MKLDPTAMRYLSDDDFRVLTAVEMGMRNHDLVPVALISAISGLRHGGSVKSLKEIHKHKLVHKETKGYVGYRLTSLGYDYLGMRALVKRGVLAYCGRAIGVGKEADVFMVSPSEKLYEEVPELNEQPYLAMKLHRLGRTSFRNVKAKRDYLCHRKAASWIYFSRLAAIKEYAFMCALFERDFPVPRPLGQSRHIVVMEMIDGVLLSQLSEIGNPLKVAQDMLDIIARLALYGLIHCDLNEFNVIVSEEEKVTVIDFPQMVSTKHADAEALFNRDVNGVVKFFSHKYEVNEEDMRIPKLREILSRRSEQVERLDVMVAASGFKIAQDDSEENAEIADEPVASPGINLETLDLNFDRNAPNIVPEALAENNIDDTSDMDEKNHVESSTEVVLPDGVVSLDKKLIAEKVRRQRANQARRRQLSRRNVVKNTEKRKIKAEMNDEMWH